MTTCLRCVMDDTKPGIVLDTNGICNWCHWHDKMEQQYPNDLDGTRILYNKLKGINEAGYGHTYDCIIGVSGGCDSSYLLMRAVEAGLRPLAVNYDNTYTTKQSTDNIYNITTKLDVDLETFTVDYDLIDTINLAFIEARLPDIDAATDVALTKVLMEAARKNNVKYVLDAHDFRSEGTTPLGWLYFDGKYVESVYNNSGKNMQHFKDFPNLWLKDQLNYMRLGIKRPRLMYYMKYNRDSAASILKRDWGWTDYGGKHAENTWTLVYNHIWLPEAFELDLRMVFLSSQVRSGRIDRTSAMSILDTPPIDKQRRDNIVGEMTDRLGYNLNLQIRLLKNFKCMRRSYKDYNTYLPTFKRYGWLLRAAARRGMLPATFITKYVDRRD